MLRILHTRVRVGAPVRPVTLPPLLALLALLALLIGPGLAQRPVSGSLRPVGAAIAKPSGPLSPRLAWLAAHWEASDAVALSHKLSLPADGPGRLLRDPAGRVLVYLRTRTDRATLRALGGTGAELRHISVRYGMVTALVAPQDLAALAELPGVSQIVEALAPGSGTPTVRTPLSHGSWDADEACPSGAIVSEGDAILRADAARATYGLDGSGVRVGVLSDSFDVSTRNAVDAADDIASGDLPGPGNPCGRTSPVHVVDEPRLGVGIDEGRGMLQIIHDLAPGAELSFASAADGIFAFADNVRRLRAEGQADILVDDWFYPEEPFFQDGPVNVAIRDVTRDGALYVTVGGNINLLDAAGRAIGSYETPAYRPIACPTITDPGTGGPLALSRDCHDFDPSPGEDPLLGITLPPGGRTVINFQWSEPWFGVRSDFDLYLVDEQQRVVARAESGLGFAPFELFSYANATGSTQTVSLVAVRFTGFDTPRFMFTLGSAALREPGPVALEYVEAANGDRFGPTITDHASSAHALVVGAAPVAAPTHPERFSSFGPATLYWRPADSIRPAQALREPVVRQKPDVLAPNGVQTTFLGRPALDQPPCDPTDPARSVCRFFGTSAAAPHVAGVLALMKQRANQAGVALSQRRAEHILERTAVPGEAASGAAGAGLVDALSAVARVAGAQMEQEPPHEADEPAW